MVVYADTEKDGCFYVKPEVVVLDLQIGRKKLYILRALSNFRITVKSIVRIACILLEIGCGGRCFLHSQLYISFS